MQLTQVLQFAITSIQSMSHLNKFSFLLQYNANFLSCYVILIHFNFSYTLQFTLSQKDVNHYILSIVLNVLIKF